MNPLADNAPRPKPTTETKTRKPAPPPRNITALQGAVLTRLRNLAMLAALIAIVVLIILGLAAKGYQLAPIHHPPIVNNSLATPGVQTGAVCRNDGGVLQTELLERVASDYNLYDVLCKDGVTVEVAR